VGVTMSRAEDKIKKLKHYHLIKNKRCDEYLQSECLFCVIRKECKRSRYVSHNRYGKLKKRFYRLAVKRYIKLYGSEEIFDLLLY
jgi:hypothetical protein